MSMTRLLMKSVLLGVLATLFLPSDGRSEFYQYEDESGGINFTDDPAKIPKKFKNKKKSRADDDEHPGSPVMRVKIKGNRVLLPVTLCYRGKVVVANFILDTGAEVSTMTPALAEKLDIQPEDTDVAFAQGIGSGVHVIGHVKLDYLLVGPNRKYDMDFIIIPAGGGDGLLGMNFLRELRYHVNFDKSIINWGD